MTASGVIPDHNGPCPRCRGTGWAPYVGPGDYAYEEPCPRGCPQPELPPADRGADLAALIEDQAGADE